MNNSTSTAALQSEAVPEAPLPPPVHEFIVRVADRGPSTRALAIVSIAGVSLFVISLLALPRKSAPLTETVIAAPVTPASAAVTEPVATVAERTPAPVLPSRVMSSPPPAPSFDSAPPSPEMSPAVAVRVEAARADTPPRVVNAPGVPDSPRGDLMPVGATSRAPIELIVAPAPPAREPEIAPSIAREELTPRPAPAQRSEPGPSTSTPE